MYGKPQRPIVAYRAGVAGFAIAFLCQLIGGVVVACLEFIGLQEAQRRMLHGAEIFYSLGIDLFFSISPASWGGTGNVLLGLISILFASLIYSLVIGITCMLVTSVAKGRPTVTSK